MEKNKKKQIDQIEQELNPIGGFIEWLGVTGGIGVNFSSPSLIDDETLGSIPETLKKVIWLNLPGSNITDSGLKHFAIAEKLEDIDLSGSRVTLSGLGKLISIQPNIVKLTALNLSGQESERRDLENNFPHVEFKFV